MGDTLSLGDSFFLLTESANTPNQVGVLVRLKLPAKAGKTFVADLVQSFRQFPVKDAPFNLRLEKGFLSGISPAWETAPQVDLDYHLRHSALPYPGGERELAILISRLHSIPLDQHRPLWEFHVIEGLEGRSFAIYSKIHHALIDGVAGARMISRWTSKEQTRVENFAPLWANPRHSNKAASKETLGGAQVHNLVEQITNPLRSAAGVLGAAYATVRGSGSSNLDGLVAPYDCPDTIFNVAVGPQRRVSTVEFETERLLKIGKALGGTLNDVVMAVCGGALRSYLLERDALPERPLVAQVPVSFRAKGDDTGGNAIGMVLASLGTNQVEPELRFETVRRSMKAGKTLVGGMDSSQITAYSAALTLPFAIGQMTGIGNRSRRPMFNVVISNVPGPPGPRYLNGAEVLSIQPISFVLQGQALNITLFTYADRISFVYTACLESLPGVQKMVPHTEAALAELEAVAQRAAKQRSKAKKRAAPKG
ncbi:MAG: diacylglycerol O-acyltransferase [Hyphomicrobiaceae bacterium]|jgi:diacylglycerol O-acyltransferase